jgi:hypothetical protein
MMIRNILILTVLAALVPTAMSNVSASSDSEIALFSGGSGIDSLSISGNADNAKMELKATNDNGKSNRVSGFQLTADNVLSTEVEDEVTVKDNVAFTKAVTTDARNNQKAIGITSNGVIDFAGYTQGVYTLDVVVDDDRAYEAIIVIEEQNQDTVKKEITTVNNIKRVTVCEGVIDNQTGACIQDPEPPIPCDEGFVREGDECVPEPTPTPGPTPEPTPGPTPEPTPIVPDPGDPVDPCSIDPTGPDCETPVEPVVLPLVRENIVEVPNEPIEELPNDEEFGEGGDTSEGDEDNGGSDNEGSEESGESEDEADDEGSEQESEGESEEKSGGN